jgi:hypothetical protein
VAEDTPPATEVEAFLSRLGDANQEELERASSAVRSDRSAWEAAGGKVAQIVASLGLDEQKAQFCERARVIVEGKAVQIQGEDRKIAIWAARGVIVSLLADGGSAERTDLGVLFKPFDQWFRETSTRAPGEFCDKHPTVPLRFGRCQRCDDKERYPPRW